MDAEKSLTFRLESYLVQLADVNRRWTDWLTGSEQAAVSQNSQGLLALQPEADSLLQELKQVIADRQHLLDDARQSGLPHSDLTSLARHLPAWDKPSLRSSLLAARQQLANLRRLHVATWVLLSQLQHFCQESMHLLMAGYQPHVYNSGHFARRTDTDGGRLLDQSL